MATNSQINRKKKKPEYKSFRLRKRIKPASFKPIPSAWFLWKDSTKFIKQHWKKVTLFLLIYMFLYILFVRGLGSAIDFANVKQNLSANGSTANGLTRSLIFFTVLVSASSATNSDLAAAYQSIIFTIGSLAFIWLIRALHSKNSKNIRVKDAFYQGMQPLIPFILVFFILALEIIPLSIATYLLSIALSSTGISIFETGIFILLAALVSLISLYLVSGTWSALYIVTLPKAEPWASVKASNKLISVHRWYVMRRLLALVAFVLLTAAILIIPLLMVLPDGFEYIAEYGFYIYVLIAFTIAHTYLYKLYKSLL